MANGISKQFDFIKDDLKKEMRKLTKNIATDAKYDLIRADYSIIQNFYDEYTPNEYVRTKNLYHMVNPQPIMKSTNYGHTAGIVDTSLTMFENYVESPTEVFDVMWNKGNRGLRYQELHPVWYPTGYLYGKEFHGQSPHDIMCQVVDNWESIYGGSIREQRVANKFNKKIIVR